VTGSPFEAPHSDPESARPPAGDAYTAAPGPPPPAPKRRRKRRRRAGGFAALLVAAAAIAYASGGSDELSALPVVGRDANTVYRDIRAAGLPVTDGRPSSSDYDDLVDRNACESSRTFVRTDTDVGWAIICVDPPAGAYRRMNDAFDEVPTLMGPLYVDDGGGDVVIFGLGWPADASKQLYDAIGGSGGGYLVDH
jgi:hypothetical protein